MIKALRQQYLFPFVWRVFDHLHPTEPFLPSWHVEAICQALTKVASGETRRLLITVPQRHGKSICTAVALPAWLLGRDPALKVMVASYGSDLALKHARDFRMVVLSDWYRDLFPRTRLEAGGNRAEEQITTRGGGRKAVSLGGAATGFGAELIIFDDLPSRLLETGGFEWLNLRAIATEDEVIPLSFGRVEQRRKGEALCPEREPLETLERLRIEMGNFAFSCQYQQDPVPPGGNRIRWEWFRTYEAMPARTEFQCVVQSWDTVATGDPESDFSVGMTWGIKDGCWYLVDLIRAKLDFPDLKHRVKAQIEK